MSKETGGPAFPRVVAHAAGITYAPGMTLRDYFAAKALPWCLTDLPAMPEWAEVAAQSAYRIADAMLAERAK